MIKASIVIPTFNEKNNIQPLLKEIFAAVQPFPNIDLEVIIVDDNSPDETGQKAEEMSKLYPVRVIHRKEKLGLGSAVMEGFALSDRNYLGVMDGDLSHDPAIIPELIFSLENYDIAIGSRFQESSHVNNWRLDRKIISNIGLMLAKLIIKTSDPLSGYFSLNRKVLTGFNLTSSGYKILLEILVKGNYSKINEIPFVFRSRGQGKSKLNYKEYLLFMKQVLCFSIKKIFHQKDR
ncbi:MAG TPA: hypothetical protein DD381_08700 [Lentisphaeria bacterium]|nr:MAG: hypothetical protein A2X47_08145 [Lentisphaerae bacterium GWF2_38_69]HBM16402.1 hypothetical protein [Lentisphaeria bacterium]